MPKTFDELLNSNYGESKSNCGCPKIEMCLIILIFNILCYIVEIKIGVDLFCSLMRVHTVFEVILTDRPIVVELHIAIVLVFRMSTAFPHFKYLCVIF